MRIVHTADWHLGQRFNGFDRYEEHQCFLNWLLETIETHSVEAIVVAGDIFDSANPNPASQKQYYSFLAKLSKSTICRDVVIVGGNHDNPHLLNAPGSILKALNVHVVGAVPEEFNEQCISLPTGEPPKLVVAAVPFLRDKDVRQSALGETLNEQENRVAQGIAKHYEEVAKCIRHHRADGVPVLATGHLFAQGCSLSDTERPIHTSVGSLGQIAAEALTDAFDYIALGHLHRHQMVGGHEHIRYSGSPLPLSFSERDYEHRILVLDFNGAAHPRVTHLEVPCSRKLVRREGTLEQISSALGGWNNDAFRLPAWAEVIVADDESPVSVNDQLDALSERLKAHILIVKRAHVRATRGDVSTPEESSSSEDNLSNPALIFERLLDAHAIAADSTARENLISTFAELLSLEDILEAE